MSARRLSLFAAATVMVVALASAVQQLSSPVAGSLSDGMTMSSMGTMMGDASSGADGAMMMSSMPMDTMSSSAGGMMMSSMGAMEPSSSAMQASSMGMETQSSIGTAVSSAASSVGGGAIEAATSSWDSSYVSTVTCSNTTKSVDVSVTGTTQPAKFTRVYPKPKGTVTQSYALRCDRAAAESSAKDAAKAAFRNACPAAPDCTKGCDNTNYSKTPADPAMTVSVSSTTSPDVMQCAGGKAYAATATITNVTCTTTNVCTAPKPPYNRP